MQEKIYERPSIKKIENNIPNKAGLNLEQKPQTHIDGIAVKDLIADYGSPLFVLSEKKIRANYRNAKRIFETRYPKVQFAWSYKTNYLDAVCNIYHQEGSWAEVVSRFEFDKAIALGVDGSHIIFNGPEKKREDLKIAIEKGSLIHIDHLDEFYMIAELSAEMEQRPKVAIRVNMDTGIHPMWDRFGFNYENGQAWDVLNKIMHSSRMDLIGLHCHIGTFILAPQAYGVAATKLADLCIGLKRKFNHSIKYIDMGGGFASSNTLKGAYMLGADISPQLDDYAEVISSALLNSEINPNEMPVLMLESGRALIDDAGHLLGTVIANKRSSANESITICDVGINILFTSFWYDHKISPAQQFSQYTEPTRIYGPLCMNIDVIRESVEMPLLRKGDHFVINHVGAYNMTQWWQFITMRPNVILIDEASKTHLIRKAENINNITDQELLPAHLKEFEF